VQISRLPRRRALVAAVLVGLLAALAPSASADAGTVRVPRQYFGLQDGSMKAYRNLDFGALRLWDSHVTWRDIETSPGHYDWSWLDSYVRHAQRHHVQVTLVLAMTPSFYSAAPNLPPRRIGHYRDFVRTVMRRYRSFHGDRGIAAYQVWNEGNLPYFWNSSPRRLARMTRTVWRIHQHVDPRATIVAPSFAVRLDGQRRWLSAYERQRLGGHPVRDFYDANALSLYPKAWYGTRPGGPEDAMRLLALAKHRLVRAGVPRRTPLWATEINYGLTGEPSAAHAISETEQVANVIRTYVLGAARGLDRMFWYRYDWGLLPASSGGGTLGNTLLSVPGSPTTITRAGVALRTVQRWLHGRLVGRHGHPPCRQGSVGTYTCVVRYAGGVRWILWNPDRPVRVALPRGAQWLHGADGSSSRVDGRDATIEVSYLPVMVTSRR